MPTRSQAKKMLPPKKSAKSGLPPKATNSGSKRSALQKNSPAGSKNPVTRKKRKREN